VNLVKILVSGAGIAGLSAVIDLEAAGHDVTIVERADHLRVNGSPIDIRGDSIAVAEKMGVLDDIHDRRIDMTERVQFVDRDGAVVAEIPEDHINDSADDIEIPREDLTRILHANLGPQTRLLFAESIVALRDDGAGVDVDFASGRTDRYELVIGADGMHSAVRRLTFGQERQYLHHLGLYVALADIPDFTPSGRTNPMYNYPGHLIGIAAFNDQALAIFSFRSTWIDYDYHDLRAQKKILADAFAGHDEWRIPELLDAAQRDPEFYFDSISQIRMPRWHQGRVVLVGDAAHCASNLSGRGTSLALTGTWYLAEALRSHPDDLGRAFEQYEQRQRPLAVRAQATAGPGGELLVPATRDDLDQRNSTFRPAPAPRG
jgi:2-polyprenyl-6-methoxyphenol hydroxylase-like FAD-dependent oxidoreductase